MYQRVILEYLCHIYERNEGQTQEAYELNRQNAKKLYRYHIFNRKSVKQAEKDELNLSHTLGDKKNVFVFALNTDPPFTIFS